MKKNLIKIFVAALFASFLIGMTGCANPSQAGDSGSGNSGASEFLNDKDGLLDEFKSKKVVAWFMWDSKDLGRYTMQKAYIFFEDKTFCLSEKSGSSNIVVEAQRKGTYTGDPTVDGKVVLNETHTEFNDGGKRSWKESKWNYDFEIKNNAYVVEYSNGKNYYNKQ